MTSRPQSLRARAALPAALLLVALSATTALAQDVALGGKLRTGDTIVMAADETVDGDLYVMGGSVTIDGTVTGDLVAAGGDIRVNGSVGGDLLAAGGTVTIAGTVEGDARAAGGQLTVSGEIGEDLMLAGGQATIAASGSVGEDVIATAGQLVIAGTVAGSVEGGAGTYERSGTVSGSENVAVGQQAEAEEDERDDNPILDALRHYVLVVLVGALALWLFPRLTRAAAEAIRRRPLASFGVGLLTALGWVLGVIAVVLVIVLAAIVFGLISFGELAALIAFAGFVLILVATFVLFIIVSYLAEAVVGLAMASFIGRREGSRWLELGLLAAGAAVAVFLTSLPVVGGPIKLVMVILGLGSLALASWTGWRARRVARPPPGPDPVWGA